MPVDRPPTACNLQFRFLNDLDDTPAFAGGQRTRFYDAYLIADLRFELVVSHEFLTLPNVLAVDRMFNQAVDADDNGLGHLVRGHDADLFGSLAAMHLLVR